MAIKFQYNKTSLHQQEKQLKMRVRTLPTIKSKESALRLEVKKTKDEVVKLEQKLEDGISSYRHMVGLWNEFNPELISEVKPFSLFNSPSWFSEGLELLKVLATTGIEAEFLGLKLEFLEYARKKTTQKVNLFEKVQIPGYKDAIRKIKRYLEDEESLSKSSQKIMRANIEERERKEKEALL